MNCLLLEPIISQLIGVALGNDKCPGWMSFAGAVVVAISINLMARGELEREVSEEDDAKQEKSK